MKALEITEAGKEALLSGKYKMVRINYANPDMVRRVSVCPGAGRSRVCLPERREDPG
jgi:bisphosphoglycerate-independent phosphoglycerate mutase (AlkP superfamily)